MDEYVEYFISRCHLYVCMRARHHHLCVDITLSSVLCCYCYVRPGGRQGQTSRCHHGELGFLREKLSFLLIWTFGISKTITGLITQKQQNYFPRINEWRKTTQIMNSKNELRAKACAKAKATPQLKWFLDAFARNNKYASFFIKKRRSM